MLLVVFSFPSPPSSPPGLGSSSGCTRYYTSGPVAARGCASLRNSRYLLAHTYSPSRVARDSASDTASPTPPTSDAPAAPTANGRRPADRNAFASTESPTPARPVASRIFVPRTPPSQSAFAFHSSAAKTPKARPPEAHCVSPSDRTPAAPTYEDCVAGEVASVETRRGDAENASQRRRGSRMTGSRGRRRRAKTTTRQDDDDAPRPRLRAAAARIPARTSAVRPRTTTRPRRRRASPP